MGRHAKLTLEQQRQVHDAPGPLVHYPLAQQFNVHPYTIYRIRKRDPTNSAQQQRNRGEARPTSCPVCQDTYWYETDLIGMMYEMCQCGPSQLRPRPPVQLNTFQRNTPATPAVEPVPASPTTAADKKRRAREIAVLWYGGCTLQEIGEQAGITRERVRQILRKEVGDIKRPGVPIDFKHVKQKYVIGETFTPAQRAAAEIMGLVPPRTTTSPAQPINSSQRTAA